MYGYIVEFEGMPKPLWGCETSLTNYSWKNRHGKNMLEISVVKADEMTVVSDGVKREYKKFNHITCTVGCDEKEAFSDTKTKVEILSAAVEFPKLKIKKCNITNEPTQNGGLFLPAVNYKASSEEVSTINSSIHKFIKFYSENTPESRLLCSAVFLEIIVTVSKIAKSQLSGNKENVKNYYIKKINYIIERDYREKLTEETVAKEVGISPVYLSSIYKEVTGTTFSKYLQTIRMQKAGELLLNSNIPTSKIATLSGYSDESYFRKKFKNYYGMTVKEYRLIKNGITLYHEKPKRKAGL